MTAGPETPKGIVLRLGAIFFLGSLIPYVGSMYCAYQTQRGLRDRGEIKSGPWQVLVAALILNPFLIGFYVPLSVSWAARSAMLRIKYGGGHATGQARPPGNPGAKA